MHTIMQTVDPTQPADAPQLSLVQTNVWDVWWEDFMREVATGVATKNGKPSSRHTLWSWQHASNKFCAFLYQTNRPLNPLKIERADIVAYAESVQEDTASINTYRSRMIPLGAFFRWMARTRQDFKSPMEGFRIPAPVRGPGEAPPDEWISAVLKACVPPPRWTGEPGASPRSKEPPPWIDQFEALRDRAIFLFLVGTGCRADALCSLCWEYVDVKHGSAIVRWKGGGHKKVRFERKTAQALVAYHEEYALHKMATQTYLDGPKKNEPVHAVWITRRGQLTQGGLRKIFARRIEMAGVEWRNPHQFRHYMGSQLHRSNIPTHMAKKIFGSVDQGSFERYGSFAEEEMLDEHRASIVMEGRFTDA